MSLFAGSHLLTKLNIRYPHHESSFVNSLAKFFESQSFLDLIFICKRNIHVKAHKMILSSVSEFLKSVIMTNSQDVVYVNLPDVEDTKLQLLLNVFYGGNGKVNGQDLYIVKDIVELLRIDIPIAVIQDISANTKSSTRTSVGMNTDDALNRFNRNAFPGDPSCNQNNMGNYYLQQGGAGGSMDMLPPQSGSIMGSSNASMPPYQMGHPYMQAFPQFPMSGSQQLGTIKQEHYNAVKEDSDDDVILIDNRAPTICLSDDGSPEKRYVKKSEVDKFTPRPMMIDSSKRRGSKLFTEDQRNYMEQIYATNKFPTGDTYNRIAEEFGIPRKHIQSWFSHKREKERKKGQTPVKVEVSPGERKKVRFNTSQVIIMEDIYKKTKFPLRDTVIKLAADFNLPFPSVNRWFLHRRVVENKAQREGRCIDNSAVCETKTSENMVLKEGSGLENLGVSENNSSENLAVKETKSLENLPPREIKSSDNLVVKENKTSESLAVKKTKNTENLTVKKARSTENVTLKETKGFEKMHEFSEEQHAILNKVYERNGVPEPQMMEYFAAELNSTVPLLNKWFERKLKSDRKKPVIDVVSYNPVVRVARVDASLTTLTKVYGSAKPKSILEVLGKEEVPRVVLLKRHVRLLEEVFKINKHPGMARICELAVTLKLPSERVRKWFIKRRKKAIQLEDGESDSAAKLSPMKLKKKSRGLYDWVVLKPNTAKGGPENVQMDETNNDANNENASQALMSSVNDKQKGSFGLPKQGLDQVLAETTAEWFGKRGPTKPGSREVTPAKNALSSENEAHLTLVSETLEVSKSTETVKKSRPTKRKLLEDLSDSDSSTPSKKEKKSPIEEKVKRRSFTERQRKVLEDHYARKMYPNHKEVEELAEELNLPFRSVNAWFGNRRRKDTKVPPEIMQPIPNEILESTSNEIVQAESKMEEDDTSAQTETGGAILHASSDDMMPPVEEQSNEDNGEEEKAPSPALQAPASIRTTHENEPNTPSVSSESEKPVSVERTEKSPLANSVNEKPVETEECNEKHGDTEELCTEMYRDHEELHSKESSDSEESSRKTPVDTVDSVRGKSPVVECSSNNNVEESSGESQEPDEGETAGLKECESSDPEKGDTTDLDEGETPTGVTVKTEVDDENSAGTVKSENDTSSDVNEEVKYELNQLQLNVLEEVYIKHGIPDALMIEALKEEINLPNANILRNWFRERKLRTDVDPEPFKCTWDGCTEQFADVDLLSKHFDTHS